MRVTTFEAGAMTGLLVAGATWLGARINSTSQAKRERDAREAERRQVFEQETLIGLQDALQDLYRLVEEHLKERFPSEIDQDQVVDLPPGYPIEPLAYRTAQATVDKLQSRVLDDDLRTLIDNVLDIAGSAMVAKTMRAADQCEGELWELSNDVNQLVGERLRRLFEP
jgi:hypothetical protein